MRRALPRLIITADDLGRDTACTSAIVASLSSGSITSASIMANGECFAEACALVRSQRLEGRIGVHLALDEGPPLSREMQRFASADGELCVSRRLSPLSRELAAAIVAECSAQIDRVISAGITPTHLDSHRHIHTVFPIGRLVVKLALRYKIPYVRPARNLTTERSSLRRTYKWLFNRYVSAHVLTAQYFGDIVDFFTHRYRVDAVTECMIHLDESERGLTGRRLLVDPSFQDFLHGYELVTHSQAWQ